MVAAIYCAVSKMLFTSASGRSYTLPLCTVGTMLHACYSKLRKLLSICVGMPLNKALRCYQLELFVRGADLSAKALLCFADIFLPSLQNLLMLSETSEQVKSKVKQYM